MIMKSTSVFKKNINFLVIFTITAAFLPRFAFSQATNPKSHAVTVNVSAYSIISVTPATLAAGVFASTVKTVTFTVTN